MSNGDIDLTGIKDFGDSKKPSPRVSLEEQVAEDLGVESSTSTVVPDPTYKFLSIEVAFEGGPFSATDLMKLFGANGVRVLIPRRLSSLPLIPGVSYSSPKIQQGE
jgi:hypothetical protein